MFVLKANARPQRRGPLKQKEEAMPTVPRRLQAVVKPSRVRLVKTIDPVDMPLGMTGDVIDGPLVEHGMNLVLWDNGAVVPMFRSEISEA